MFVLAWTSGHKPPRTMYFTETERGWCAGETIDQAKQFKTAAEAIATWRSKHAFPDNEIYQQAWKSGRIRTEQFDQGALLL